LSLTTCSGAVEVLRGSRDGVTVRRVAHEPTDTGARFRAGDLELRGDRVTAVFAQSGAIRFVAFPGREDAALLGPLRGLLWADGREVSVLRGALEPVLEDGVARVRWRGEVTTATGVPLDVVRDARIDPADRALVWQTTVRRRSPGATIAVSAGIEARVAASSVFAPGVGLVSASAEARVPWLGVAVEHDAWALLTPGETLRARVEPDGDAARARARVSLRSEARPLDARGSITFVTRFIGAAGDLGDLAREAWREHGDATVETTLTVRAADAIERAYIVVTRPDGSTVLVADMERNRPRAVALPPGVYVAYAFAHGHGPSDAVRFTAGAAPAPIALEIPSGGVIQVTVRDADGGGLLPARIVVRGVDGTPDPMLGPVSSASGAELLVVAAGGLAEITVPPGTFEVTTSRGPEWSIEQTRVVVTPTLRGDVRASLAHSIAMDDWTACDLHVHSAPSGDSQVTVEDRVASLIAEGVEFAAATEHNTVGDYAAGMEALPRIATPAGGGPGLVWVPAVEVTTDRSPEPVGHFNVYPYPPEAGVEHGGPPPFDAVPAEIFRAARARQPDGVIQVNHPRMEPGIGYFDRVGLDTQTNIARSPLYDPGYDALEVFNGYYVGSPREVERVMHDWFALLNTGARYVGTASSDSHVIAYFEAGYPRTYVYTPGAGNRSPDAPAVIAALRAGHAFGT
ncbi:MAG: CehA/McbA family metallohydrolase, partial [Deltaproteobacteria bacterium]